MDERNLAKSPLPRLKVVLVYSPAPRQVVEVFIHVPPGALLSHAYSYLAHSDAAALGITAGDWGRLVAEKQVGIWGKRVTQHQADPVLQANDRVELYRALTVDPKVARRERFVKQGAKAAGLFATRRPGAKAGY